MRATAAAQQHSIEPEWFVSWFDSAHYQRLYAHRDEREAGAFVDALIQRLPMTGNASVLDLGCGNGRHATHLAARGFHVAGLDLSAESLAVARARPGGFVQWIRQDMRRPFGAAVYDYVLSLFTSFGYFEHPGDHLGVVSNVARSLTTGGRFVLDYLNTRHAEAHLVGEERIRREGVDYRISRWSDGRAIFKRIVTDARPGERSQEFVERVSKLAIDDFRFMFALCGLRIDALYGDYSLVPFDTVTSPRLILVATKVRSDSSTCGTGACECGSRSPASSRDRTRAWIAARGGQSRDSRGGTPGTAPRHSCSVR
jgi:SAM-dependent methyltransferase